MKKVIVRPLFAKAFLICILVSIVWTPEIALTFFDVTGGQYFMLKSFDRMLTMLMLATSGLWLIETAGNWTTAKGNESPPRPIHIHAANLNLDAETLAPYKDDLIALIKSHKPVALDVYSKCVSTPIAERVDFPALYEETMLEKVREDCPCGAEARAECYAFKGQG